MPLPSIKPNTDYLQAQEALKFWRTHSMWGHDKYKFATVFGALPIFLDAFGTRIDALEELLRDTVENKNKIIVQVNDALSEANTLYLAERAKLEKVSTELAAIRALPMPYPYNGMTIGEGYDTMEKLKARRTVSGICPETETICSSQECNDYGCRAYREQMRG